MSWHVVTSASLRRYCSTQALTYVCILPVPVHSVSQVSWFVVGCYYLSSGRHELARRYLSKSSSLPHTYLYTLPLSVHCAGVVVCGGLLLPVVRSSWAGTSLPQQGDVVESCVWSGVACLWSLVCCREWTRPGHGRLLHGLTAHERVNYRCVVAVVLVIVTKICPHYLSSVSTLWFGARKSIRPVKIEWWDANCLHIVQLMPLHPKTPPSLASIKSTLVFPFGFRLTQVDVEKWPLNGRSSI